MPAHIFRLLLVLVGFFVVAITARNYVLDPSYYEFGAYRGDAVAELMVGTPQFRGPAHCQGCHADRHAEWAAGTHEKVKCEVCHGPAGDHPVGGALPIPDDSIALCTLCHEAMPSRPGAQPQIVVAEHPVKHEGDLQCATCHNPHSPRIGGPPVPAAAQTTAPPTVEPVAEASAPSARLATLVAPCVACHGVDGRGVGPYQGLAGNDQADLVRKLQEYRSGALADPMMNAVTRSLSDEDIAELAEHYAGLPPGPPQ